ncbi:hypothetical protein L2K70_19690 [Nocardioides KLBMP 9356]|uniref:Uncharacterized protein n=1 Tax=Nocardioides potassii TaxID=2911371 RepID=A0ABS9HHG4_9ACTN|nr:hypothetical protein [Nocardioides potassii]MCF6379842.1 hypothetical protein [Nocardioides potassii]
MMATSFRLAAPGVTTPVVALRALVVLLPCAALALALPEVPHWFVLVVVPVTAVMWARAPDHGVGIIPLVLVAGWWAAHGVVDWRVLVVAVLLLGAHVAATLLSYGPPTLAVDPHLVRVWVVRALLAVVPVPVAWLAVRGLDPRQAPAWLWLATAALTGVLLLVTTRLTRSESAR